MVNVTITHDYHQSVFENSVIYQHLPHVTTIYHYQSSLLIIYFISQGSLSSALIYFLHYHHDILQSILISCIIIIIFTHSFWYSRLSLRKTKFIQTALPLFICFCFFYAKNEQKTFTNDLLGELLKISLVMQGFGKQQRQHLIFVVASSDTALWFSVGQNRLGYIKICQIRVC